MKELTSDIELSKSIFKSNLSLLIKIYENNRELIDGRINDLEKELEDWSKRNTGRKVAEIEDNTDWFLDYTDYKFHFDYYLLHLWLGCDKNGVYYHRL